MNLLNKLIELLKQKRLTIEQEYAARFGTELAELPATPYLVRQMLKRRKRL